MKPEKFTTLQRLSLAAICAAYTAIRFWDLTSSCLWFDEIFSVQAAEQSWNELPWFITRDLIHPPLFYAALKLWIGLGGEHLLWLRSFSVFVSILAAVPFLYLCRELKLRFPATLAALVLFSINGALIKYAQEVRMYSFLLFLSLVSFWLFSRFYFRGKNIWVLTVVNILLIYTHYYGWFVIAAEVLATVVFQRIKIRNVLVMLGIALASFVPWFLMVGTAWRNGADINQNIGWIKRPTAKYLFDLAADIIEPFYYQQSSVDAASLYYISIPLLAVITAAAIIYLSRFRDEVDRSSIYLLTIFAGLPLAASFLFSWLLPVSIWGSRHLIIVFPPAVMLAAIFLTGITQKWARMTVLLAGFVIILAAFAVRIRTEPQQYIWCAWEKFAGDLKASDAAVQTPIYTFEELIAYHIWFALRDSGSFRVKVVKGIKGLTEDTAYFLPRGFGEVEKLDESGITGDRFWIGYRATRFDPGMPPLKTIEQRGYQAGEVKVIQGGTEKAFLVEFRRRP